MNDSCHKRPSSTASEKDILTLLNSEGCERLKEWSEIGPVQRAAVLSFADAILSINHCAFTYTVIDIGHGNTKPTLE